MITSPISCSKPDTCDSQSSALPKTMQECNIKPPLAFSWFLESLHILSIKSLEIG
jgi:hypothetical protein